MIHPSEGLKLEFEDGHIETVYRFTENVVYCQQHGKTNTIISMFEWKLNFSNPSKIKKPFKIVE